MNLKAKQFIDTYIGMPLVYINLFFARLLGFIFKRNHTLNEAPSEICIIKLLGFGSVIMASDTIYSMKIKYPTSRLTIICSKGIAEGIESLQMFDEIYIINDESFFKTVFSSLSIILKLQQKKNLWTIDLEVYSKLTSILSLWTLAKNRIGFYFNQVKFRYNLNTHNIYFNTTCQVEENYVRIIQAMGIDSIATFKIPSFEKKNETLLQHSIAINNTCSELSPERKMNDKQLANICNWILNNTQFNIVLLGAQSDFQHNQQFIEKYCKDSRINNIAGVYSFTDYYNFLYQNCKVMITIDSAPLHIAHKLSIPTISIWGPTSPASRINVDSTNDFVYLKTSCSPCAHFVEKLPCGGNNFCINDIQLDRITSLILKHI